MTLTNAIYKEMIAAASPLARRQAAMFEAGLIHAWYDAGEQASSADTPDEAAAYHEGYVAGVARRATAG